MARPFLILLLVGAFLTGTVQAQEVPDRLVAVGSNLDVNSEVAGDVVVFAGDLILGPGAVVHGDAIAVLGRIERKPGAIVDGRALGLTSLATLEVEPDLERGAGGGTRAAVMLLVMGGWLLATSLITWVAPLRIQEGVRFLRGLRWRIAVIGVLALATYFAALLATLGFGPVWGVPLSGALVVLFVAVKAVGLAVIGASLGRFVVARSGFSTMPTSIDVFVGVALLLLLRLLPWVGGFAWAALSVLALGAGAFNVVGMTQRVADQVVVRSP